MTTYLGNPSLSTAVKDRVQSTFQQAVTLYQQRRMDEVVAGCGLILQMDPMFDPARKLLDAARNPGVPFDVSSVAAPADAADALSAARQAMAARDYQRVVNITTEILTNDLMNDDARILGDQAREKMEAAPFVDQFVRKAEALADTGNMTAARAELQKARGLDPDHPAVARLAGRLGGAAQAAPAAAPPAAFSFNAPGFVEDQPAPPSGRGTAQAADFGFTFEEEKPAAAAPMSFSFDAPAAPGSFSFDAPTAQAPAAPPAPAPAPAPKPEPPAASGGFEGFSFGGGAASTPAADPFAGGFSFDEAPTVQSSGAFAAAPTPKAPVTGEFDFASAAAETSSDDLRKIEQYLADGDRAMAAGDPQQAIDLWSRIFLIDVTNEAASERIEKAKARRRELEQRIDPLLQEGSVAFDRQDFVTARQKFAEVLKLDPNNATALDYTRQMASGAAPEAPAFEPVIPPSPMSSHSVLDEDELADTYETPQEPAPRPAAPAKGAKAVPAAKPAKAAAPGKKLPLGLIAAIIGIVVVLGGGFFAYTKFFGKAAYDPAATQAALKEAAALGQRGRYDEAIAMLQEIKPDDPQHDKALNMIADLQHRKAQGSEMINGRPAAVVYQENLTNAKAAYDAHDYAGAQKAFEAAAAIKPLPADMKALYDAASTEMGKLQGARALFKEQKYQDAIGSLGPMLQADPQNKTIQQMLAAAYFDLGAQALQEERVADAQKSFDEVLKIDPTDELAKRSRELAARYDGKPKDLLYKIYVKYLPLRQAA